MILKLKRSRENKTLGVLELERTLGVSRKASHVFITKLSIKSSRDEI